MLLWDRFHKLTDHKALVHTNPWQKSPVEKHATRTAVTVPRVMIARMLIIVDFVGNRTFNLFNSRDVRKSEMPLSIRECERR